MSSLLEDVSPVLFSALTGNEIGAAVAAAKGIADIFGWTDHSPDAVKTSLQHVTELQPQQQIDLFKLNNQFALQQKQLENADTANAREYSSKHIVADIISLVTFAIFVANLLFPQYVQIESSKLQFLYMAMSAVFTYYVGSGQLPLKNILSYLGNEEKTGG
jgi:hypothetical protein